MEIKVEDILDLFGSKATTLDEFKAEHAEKYVTEQQIFKDEPTRNKYFGRILGSTATNTKKEFEKFGVELQGEFDNQPEKVVAAGLAKLQELHETRKAEDAKMASLTKDEQIQKYEETINQLKAKTTDYEKLVKSKGDEFSKLLAEKDNQIKSIRLNTHKEAAERSIQYLPDLDPYKKKGWLTEMSEKYRIDQEEDGTPFIVNASDGSRIKSDKHISSFLTPEEVYQTEAVKAGLMTLNPKGGKPAPANQFVAKTPAPVVQPKPPITPGIGARQMATAARVD